MADTDQRSTFLDRQRDAALERIRSTAHRDRQLAVLAGFDQRSHIGHVVSLSPADDDDAEAGVFAVQVVRYRRGESDTSYTTVVRGKNDRLHFNTLDFAVLHALAQTAPGYRQDMGAAATFAGRTLGLTPDSDHT